MFAFSLARTIVGHDHKLVEVIGQPAVMLALIFGYVWMLGAVDGLPSGRLAALGLPGGWRAVRHAVAGVGLGAGAVFLTLAPIAFAAQLKFERWRDSHGVLVLWVEVFVVLSTAAMAEEVAFRGYPFHRLIEATGRGGAIAVFAAVFGLAHLRNPNATILGFLNTILIGVVFAVAYLRARTLWLPWGMHWAWNALLGAVFGFPVSGLDMSVSLRTRASGPPWLTGGEYGPEASVACTFTLAVMLVAVLIAFRRRPAPDGTPQGVTSAGSGESNSCQ